MDSFQMDMPFYWSKRDGQGGWRRLELQDWVFHPSPWIGEFPGELVVTVVIQDVEIDFMVHSIPLSC